MASANPKLTKLDFVRSFIQRKPGCTQQEIREAMYGPLSYRDVGRECRRLVDSKRFSSTGRGKPGDPFRYYPEKKDS